MLNDKGKFTIGYSGFIENICYYEQTWTLSYLINRQNRFDTIEFNGFDNEFFYCVVKRDNTYNSIFLDRSDLHDDFFNLKYNIMQNFKEFSRLQHKREYYTENQNSILASCYRITSGLFYF